MEEKVLLFHDAVIREGAAKGKRYLSNVLFTIIYAFVADEDYNGAVRHMLKSFVHAIDPVVRKVLMAKETVAVGFLLTALEAKL